MSRSSSYGAVAGFAYLACFFANVALLFVGVPGGGPPDDPAQRLAWVTDHASRVGARALLVGLAALAFAWFVSALYVRLRFVSGSPAVAPLVALIGGVLYAVLLLVSSSLTEQTATSATIDHSQVVVQVVSYISLDPIFFDAEWALPVALLLAGTAAASWKGGTLPVWFSRGSAVLALLLFLGAIVTYIPRRLVTLPLLLVYLLWVATASVLMLAKKGVESGA